MIRITITDTRTEPELAVGTIRLGGDDRGREILTHLVRIATDGSESEAEIVWGDVKGVMHEPSSAEIYAEHRNTALDEAAAIAEDAHFLEVRDQILALKAPT